MDQLAEDEFCRFQPPKSVQEEDSLLAQSKPKSTQYKDKWAVEVFRTWQAACEPKFCILDPGSMFKEYDLHCVQSLEEQLKELDSLSLNYWLTKFVQQVANKNGARGMFNSGTFLNCTVHVNVKANNRSNKVLLKLCIAFSN